MPIGADACILRGFFFHAHFSCYSSFAREGRVYYFCGCSFSVFWGLVFPFFGFLNGAELRVEFHGYLFLGAPFYNIFDITCHRIAEYLRSPLLPKFTKDPAFSLLFPPRIFPSIKILL